MGIRAPFALKSYSVLAPKGSYVAAPVALSRVNCQARQPEMPTELQRVKARFKELHSAALTRFPEPGGSITAPSDHGVYAIVAPRGSRVLHVGRTVTGRRGLKHRLSNHLQGKSSFVTLYLREQKRPLDIRRCWFKYVVEPNARIRALLEAYATGQYCPAHIGIARSVLDRKELSRDAA